MNWYGSGFIPQIIYAQFGESGFSPSDVMLLAENSAPLLTELGLYIYLDE